MDLPVEQIQDPRIVLRPVRKDSVQYLELRDSIKAYGIISSVLVRPLPSDYELVAGLHRLTISRDLKFKTIPATIKVLSDREALSIQLQENVLRIDATRTEIARQLIRIQREQPDVTLTELAQLSGKSTKWVKAQLLLMELDNEIQRQLDHGDMSVMNAYELTRLPKRLHREFVGRATLMGRAEFKSLVTEKIRELQHDPRRRVYDPGETFTPHPYMRGLKEILENRREDWKDALDWVLHLDPPTIEKRKAEYEARSRHHIGKEE